MNGVTRKLEFTVSHAHSRTHAQLIKEGRFIGGTIATPFGFVRVHHECGDGDRIEPFAILHFIWNNRRWARGYSGEYTKTGLARMATRFARQVVRGEVIA